MIAYGLVLLGIVVALGALWGKGHQAGYASAKADDQPVITQINADKATAVAANVKLQGDVNTVRGLANACTAKVATLSGIGDDVRKSLNDAVANMDKRQKANASALERYLTGANAPSTGTRTEQCDEATKVLGDLSDRMTEALGPPQNAPSMAAPIPVPIAPPAAATAPKSVPPKGKLPPAVRGIPEK